jgi:antitoxin (DNA-binding transcriptional repressor) of toxin-antitoxin stability system
VHVIRQKELRNNVADVLPRAEGREEFTITVAGRPVAPPGPGAPAPMGQRTRARQRH